MGPQAELVLFGARDAVLLAQVLGGLDHAPGDRVVDASGGHAPPGEAVLEANASAAHPPAHAERVELGLAHALGASRKHQIGDPRLHLHGADHDGLKA